jgi:dTDP-4-dehydrorhamnose reductase
MNREKQRLYHLCCGRPVSWHRFAQAIVEQASVVPGWDLCLKPKAIVSIPSREYPTPALRPANSRLDCRRLEKHFSLRMPDWQPYLVRMLQLLALKQDDC